MSAFVFCQKHKWRLVLKHSLKTIALTAALAISAFGTAHADTVEAGLLTCNIEGGTGFIVGSSKDMACTFESADGSKETYTGNVKKFGIDIGSTDRTTVKWVVLAPTKNVGAGSLKGQYGGFSGEVTAGVGVGANALIGGSNRSIILQPFSGQVQTGLNIAVGIGTMTLS
jgi:hypothetical protein